MRSCSLWLLLLERGSGFAFLPFLWISVDRASAGWCLRLHRCPAAVPFSTAGWLLKATESDLDSVVPAEEVVHRFFNFGL